MKSSTKLYFLVWNALVYVDDILIIGSFSTLIQKLIFKLHDKFALHILWKLDYFLGIEVKYQVNVSLILTQTKYITDLLSKVNMEEENGVYSPMLRHCKPSQFGTDTMHNTFIHMCLVGALQYVTLTRPNITYCVNKSCQFMANLLDSHWAYSNGH